MKPRCSASVLSAALLLAAMNETISAAGTVTLPADGIIRLSPAGRAVEFQLDLTRVFLQSPEGGQPEAHVFEKPVQPADFPAVAAALEKSTGKQVLPVLLERHHPQPEAALSLLTRRVSAKTKPGVSPEALARAAGAVSVQTRVYAKDTAILEFPGVFDVLTKLPELRKNPDVLSVEPVLKSKRRAAGG